MTTPPLDLLREKRQELGLPDPGLAAAASRRLILKGTLVGGLLVAASLVATALVETRLQARRTRLKTLTTANQALVNGLVAARSGSALMLDLQRRVPRGLQLSTVEVPPSDGPLRITGSAADPQAFARINAFQIELARSPLLDPAGVQLLKAARGEATPRSAGVAAPPAGLVSFEITARFRPALPAAAELMILEELQARGMARRLQLLQGEGLLR